MADVAGQRRPSPAPAARDDPLAPLLAATARGDRAAFARLYRETSPRLMAIAHKMLASRELAEEVLQEAFLAIWQKAGRYDPDAGLAIAWLTTLVRHRAIDRLRLRGGSRETAVGGAEELEPFSAVHETTDGAIVASQSLERCLAELKAKQRRFIALAFYYGFTHEELSEKTGTPLGTVKSDMRRGLSELRSCLER